MKTLFADRIVDVPRSFTREILKVTSDRSIISFAGGLPNRELFPAEELKEATLKVFSEFGMGTFQYSNSEGYLELRELISQRYREKQQLDIPPENILITNGSQQGLDLLGKTFINEGDCLLVDEPAYFAAIQAFSVFRPCFQSVPLREDGPDLPAFRKKLDSARFKMVYTVPNFQNPSGITYSDEKRQEIAGMLRGTDTILIEDDPYRELRYTGQHKLSFKHWLPDQTILLGTFSKTVVPGFRLGWIAASDSIMDKLIVAKQAADLHTAGFTQYIVYEYLKNFDNERHMEKVRRAYGLQLNAMLNCLTEYFPPGVSFTHPEGGMFVWVTLPENLTASGLLELARREKVVFVPGDSCYSNRQGDVNTLRLNFTCENEETIREGVRRLGQSIKELMRAEGSL